MDYVIAVVGAFLAGAINTLAGNGSAITLTVLMEVLGLPANVANGTNRVGIAAQGIAGSYAFARAGRFDLEPGPKRDMYRVIIVCFLGATAGAVVSMYTSNAAYRAIFRYMLFVMLVVVLIKPKRWLRGYDKARSLPNWLSIPLFLAVGFYGGFVQMGMGIFFLAVTVLIARYDIIQANVAKMAVVAVYATFAVVLFHFQGLIDWRFGALMALGQMTGGYLTARFAANDPRAAAVAYWLLIVVIIGAILKAFVL